MWREGVIVSIVKKRDGREVRDYREVTVPTLYKVYTSMLVEKLRKEVGEKNYSKKEWKQ